MITVQMKMKLLFDIRKLGIRKSVLENLLRNNFIDLILLEL